MSVLWLAAFVLFLIAEGMTVSLTSIWFAGGALAALVAQVLGAGIKLQLGAFTAVSFLLFFMVRPFAGRYLQPKRTRTNVSAFVGRKVTVKEPVDNAAGTGSALLGGETWLASAAKEGETFRPGEIVTVVSVKGARLLVEAVAEQNDLKEDQKKEM